MFASQPSVKPNSDEEKENLNQSDIFKHYLINKNINF